MGGGEAMQTGGVKPMSIAGRVVSERERLTGMTPEERAWRRKWLADQTLTSREPQFVMTGRKDLLNPLRRLYRAPLDILFDKAIAPLIGKDASGTIRFYTGRALMGIYGGIAIAYYLKYSMNTWEGKGRWRKIEQKEAVFPGEPGFGCPSPDRAPHQYYDRGFSQSIFAKDYPQYAKCD